MNREQLFEQIKAKKSFLCVGLDTDIRKIPKHMIPKDEMDEAAAADVVLKFNRAIVDATAPYTVAYKPNLAFYEVMARFGTSVLRETCGYIRQKYPKIFIIADAKRGDIGNTSDLYAEAFLGRDIMFDAVTLSPYMGKDSVDPFLKYEDKWAIILALTSNKSADDFETLKLANGDPLWKEVLRKAKTWGTTDNTMFVVGATHAEVFKEVREIVPDHFLLVPGVGAQGGSLQEVAEHGLNDRCGLLVNSSRGIIYAFEQEQYAAAGPEKFAAAAAAEAKKMATEMEALLKAKGLLK